LLRRIDWKQDISDAEFDGVALEEIREIDEPLAALGVSVGNELVVG